MIGALVGAVGSIASAIGGGIAGKRAYKKQQKQLADWGKDNESWYNREYNKDYLSTAPAQRMMTKAEDTRRALNQYLAGKTAVMGGTEESVATQREENNQAMADMGSQIVSNAETQRASIMDKYLTTKDTIRKAVYDAQAQRAKNIATATGQAIKGISQAATSLDGTKWDFGGGDDSGSGSTKKSGSDDKDEEATS